MISCYDTSIQKDHHKNSPIKCRMFDENSDFDSGVLDPLSYPVKFWFSAKKIIFKFKFISDLSSTPLKESYKNSDEISIQKYSPRVMYVQYSGGCAVEWRIFSTGEGYHQYSGGI